MSSKNFACLDSETLLNVAILTNTQQTLYLVQTSEQWLVHQPLRPIFQQKLSPTSSYSFFPLLCSMNNLEGKHKHEYSNDAYLRNFLWAMRLHRSNQSLKTKETLDGVGLTGNYYITRIEKSQRGVGKTNHKQRARSIQPKFPEISVKNSMDRFGPTGKVSKKLVHLLRWSSFPGRTGWNFGWMDRAQQL